MKKKKETTAKVKTKKEKVIAVRHKAEVTAAVAQKKNTAVAETVRAGGQKKQESSVKKLGKSLEDISHLFLSSPKKKLRAVLKEKTTVNTKKVTVSAGVTVKPAPAKKKKVQSTVAREKIPPVTPEVPVKAVREKKTKRSINALTKTIEVAGMATPEQPDNREVKPLRAKNVLKSASDKKSDEKKSVRLGPISQLKDVFKKKAVTDDITVDEDADVESDDTVETRASNFPPEQIIGESKFFVSPSPTVQDAELYDLPSGYGDTRIVIQVRDPYWLHAYWEVTQDKLNAVYQQYGNQLRDARRVLRVYDVTEVIFDGHNAHSFFDVQVNDYANSWYVNVNQPGRGYCVEIGIVLANGVFVLLARSNCITTPLDGPSAVMDEEWMIVEDDFNKLYGLSVGLGVGVSSLDVRKQIKDRSRAISSGMLFSPGAVQKQAERKFWLVVNTELIVYGATEPDAKLTIQGQPLKLNKDGTFSVRFALPDGEQIIPVRAVSADTVEERTITPIVMKQTT